MRRDSLLEGSRGDRWRTGRRAVLLALAILVANVSGAGAATHTPPWADVFGNHWPGPDALDTTGTASKAFAQLGLSGYGTFQTNNTDVFAAMGTSDAQSDAVWVNFGHGPTPGNGGYITWCNPAHGPQCTTALYANSSLGPCSGADAVCLKTGYATSIHKIKLMVFAGCNTGNNGPNLADAQQSNLVKTAFSYNGVDSAIGFTSDVGFSATTSDAWADKFFAKLRAGSTVAVAALSASLTVASLNGGNANGWDNYFINGGGVTIVPPAYGS